MGGGARVSEEERGVEALSLEPPLGPPAPGRPVSFRGGRLSSREDGL